MKKWEMPVVEELNINETECHPDQNKWCDDPWNCGTCNSGSNAWSTKHDSSCRDTSCDGCIDLLS